MNYLFQNKIYIVKTYQKMSKIYNADNGIKVVPSRFSALKVEDDDDQKSMKQNNKNNQVKNQHNQQKKKNKKSINVIFSCCFVILKFS